MPLEIGKTYYIKNVASGKYLNIYGNSTVEDGRNVNLDTKYNVPEQKWIVERRGNGAVVKSVLNQSFGLNINQYDSNNCTMWTLSNNPDDDCVVDFLTVDASRNRYRIKIMHYNLFLALHYISDLNVYWSSINDDYALWELEEVTTSSSGGTTAGSYTYPTPSNVRRISRGILPNHNGLDIVDDPYTDSDDVPIYAFADGIVTKNKSNVDLEGNTIRIKHGQLFGDGKYIETKYLHMKYTPLYPVGASVNKGDLIGYMGNTGNSNGTHLHFEISYKSTDFNVPSGYYDADGNYDPLVYLPDYYEV